MSPKRFSEITVRNAADGKTAGQHGLNLKDMVDIIRQAGSDLFAQCLKNKHEYQPYKRKKYKIKRPSSEYKPRAEIEKVLRTYMERVCNAMRPEFQNRGPTAPPSIRLHVNTTVGDHTASELAQLDAGTFRTMLKRDVDNAFPDQVADAVYKHGLHPLSDTDDSDGPAPSKASTSATRGVY